MFPLNVSPWFSLILFRVFILSTLGWIATVWSATTWSESVNKVETFCAIGVAGLMLVHCLAYSSFLLYQKFERYDFCLSIAEIGAFVYFNRHLFSNGAIPAWAPLTFIFCALVGYLSIISMISILVLYVFSFAREPSHDLTNMKVWAIFLGRFLVTDRDSKYFPTSFGMIRKLFAGAFIVVIFVVCFFVLLVLPVHESGLVPVKYFRTDNPLTDNPGMETPVLRIMAFLILDNPSDANIESFKSAVNVTPLWNSDSELKPACEHIDGYEIYNDVNDDDNVPSVPFITRISILCPSRKTGSENEANSIFSLPGSNIFPDLLVTVNFSTLGIILADVLFEARLKAVSIAIGLANNPADVVRTTSPIPIFPETYTLASVVLTLRRLYLNSFWASVASILATQRTFFVCLVQFTMPDPSPLIPRFNDTGTLRIFPQDDLSEWYVSSDYREHDIFGGLGTVGGFWTTINGIFAFLLGSSLLWVIVGSKPLSKFGIFHGGEATKKKLAKSFPENVTDPDAQFDVKRFLQEHISESISLGPYEDLKNERSSGSDIPLSEIPSGLLKTSRLMEGHPN